MLLRIIILFLLVSHSLHAQIIIADKSAFEDKVQSWLLENKVPAVGIGIIENGKTNYIKVFGELKKGVPATDHAIFNIASITKPVVSMMVLKLVQQGQWDLNEPLYHYWTDPDVANDPLNKKLTTRHILTHQSGFDNWRIQRQDKRLTFKFEPGTNTSYSGEGFVYLARALERKFKRPLPELADSILFRPLGMKDTRLYWDKHMDASRFAYWHDSKGNIYEEPTPKSREVNAAGSMLTTVEDFCKFGIDVINGAGLSAAIYQDMISTHVPINPYYSKGLGWEVIRDLPNGEFALEHGGSDNGVKAIAILLPKSKRGIVVFTNGDNGMVVYPGIIRESIDVGATIFQKISGDSAHQVTNVSDAVLQSYAGVFLDSYGRHLTVKKQNKTLLVSGEGVPTVTLFPTTNSRFFIRDFDIQFEFTGSDSLTVIGNGKIDCTAKRIK